LAQTFVQVKPRQTSLLGGAIALEVTNAPLRTATGCNNPKTGLRAYMARV
jgi:hypothetical protein